MSTHICTHCLSIGKPVKPPSDKESGDGGVGSAAMRIAKSPFALGPFAFFIPVIALPLAGAMWLVLWPFKRVFGLGGKKHCPYCGLPLMVHLKSDKGWLAKRKLDIEMGDIKVVKKKEEVLQFGKEVKLPEPEKKPADEPFDDFAEGAPKLPTVEQLLAEEPAPAQQLPEPEPETAAPPIKKVDPEAW